MKIKSAIFDMDGTLLDSMYAWDNVGENYLIKNGAVPKADLMDNLKTKSLMESVIYLIEEYGINKSPKEIMDELNKTVEHFYFNTVTLKDGVKELLEYYKKNGVKMCVATATDSYLAQGALKHTGILDYFDFILTCSEVKCGKESPEIFGQALLRLGTKKEECLIFEDALHAVETAKRAGFTVYAVAEKSAMPDKAEIIRSADKFLQSIGEAIE